MKAEPLTGIGFLLLGSGIAASAILGPLVLGVIEFRVLDAMENQLMGGEIVSLLLVAPAHRGEHHHEHPDRRRQPTWQHPRDRRAYR